MEKERSSFSGKLGFVLAAAGSAVGLGNIWRFPYLAAENGGGLFLLCYVILALTFGFTLLTTEVALGRKTQQGPLTAYGVINKKWKPLGVIAFVIPSIILPYYCVIGGWVTKYFVTFVTGKDADTVADGYFTGFITSQWAPIIFMLVFLLATAIIVYLGVEGGIERYSKVLMPALLIMVIGISIYSLTIKGPQGTALQGLKVYVVPDFKGLTFTKLLNVILAAMGQLFFSISVSMGIMVAYGSYVKKEVNLMNSINQIEIFDTVVAFLAGLMVVPAVFAFSGKEGMSAGPGLIFVSLPKIFNEMGKAGRFIGIAFFLLVLFAAITSSVSILEAMVSSIMDKFGVSRKKSTVIASIYGLIVAVIVCLGYNKLYFEATFSTVKAGQILDILDFASNNVLMPVAAILTCILIGWVAKPKTIIDEVTRNGEKFGRKALYIAMIKVIAPVLLVILLLNSIGVFG